MPRATSLVQPLTIGGAITQDGQGNLYQERQQLTITLLDKPVVVNKAFTPERETVIYIDGADQRAEELFNLGFIVRFFKTTKGWGCSISTGLLKKIPHIFSASSRLEALQQCEKQMRDLLADPQWRQPYT